MTTKLEEEIDLAIMRHSDALIKQEAITAAAEVAKRYIEKAFHNGQSSVNTRYGEYEQNFEEWAKENGIV